MFPKAYTVNDFTTVVPNGIKSGRLDLSPNSLTKQKSKSNKYIFEWPLCTKLYSYQLGFDKENVVCN